MDSHTTLLTDDSKCCAAERRKRMGNTLLVRMARGACKANSPQPSKGKNMSTISKRHARARACVSVCVHVCVNTDSIVWISVDEDKEQQPLQGLKGHEAAVCVFTLAIASPQEITHSLGKKNEE